ncbi:multiple epidermal growth factor-like domains protein 10 [Littorina saxatilis]|uniref:EGF-like domain-containing protein n=1 Tax=Littorina saxatilis TaxID=31220 RepID=A0AAN9GAV3_9CAEN
MAPSTLSLFLTALMFAGVSGADKELGEVCATGEMCVHPSLELTCDAFAKKCLIQQDKACGGDGHKYLCVTGAECDGTSNKCTCTSTAYTASGVKCTVAEDKYGGTCLTGDTCTAASNLMCANTFCGCTAGNKPKLSDGTCEANADHKVGQVCTTDRPSGECGDPTSTFLSCPSSGIKTCTCNAGYAGPVGGTCAAIAQQKVGRVCTTSNEADATSCGPPATTNLECSNLACACKDGYYGVTGGDCDPAKGQLNGGCSATSDCSVANTVCTGSTAGMKCVCSTGYSVDTAGTACAVTENAFGGSCTGGPTGKGTCMDANAKCSLATGGTCGCQDTHSGAIGASCVLKNTIGGACTGPAKGTCEDANALCSNSKCECKEGYNGPDGGTCTKIADNTFGGSCTTGAINTKGTCVDANALCTATADGFCTCATGYAGIAGSGCALPNKLGGSCTTMTKGTQGTCETAGATCSMQENGRCVMSGAKAVVASVTSLVLACIVCLLAIN